MASEVAAQAIREAGVCDGLEPAVNELLATVGLVDHHVHGVVDERLDGTTLTELLAGPGRESAAQAAGFDTQAWLAVRRWCGPLMRAPAHVAAEDYLVARRAYERLIPIAQLLLPRAGLERVLVETGAEGDRASNPARTAALAGAKASRVARLEVIAERLVGEVTDPAAWPDAFRAAVANELAGDDPAAGFSTVLVRRVGFGRGLERPPDDEVAAAAVRWATEVREGVPASLADETLLRFGVWSAIDAGLPLQLHVGCRGLGHGTRDADPGLLARFLQATQERAPIVLLHVYPVHRAAGVLAQVFPHVYLDLGLAVSLAGAASETFVRESLELTPFTKLLYGSDAAAAPELHLLGSWLFRRAMSRVAGDWVARGDWSRGDAERVIRLIAAENARRVYRLPA